MNYTTNVGERGVATEETKRLIASDKVEGTAIFDRAGKHLGRVHHLMIDKYSGQVMYVVASFGGFFGIGENWIPLPWRALNYEPRVAGYVVDVDRNKLERAPNYASNMEPDWSDRAFGDEIEQYWFPPL
ncbi:MAG TPA: PRC-barrel domain-containing protein [Stellaceae bacterium]|nr:PRC-barrel domain-containing protein [Stellaceae bacterium]